MELICPAGIEQLFKVGGTRMLGIMLRLGIFTSWTAVAMTLFLYVTYGSI